MMTGDLHHQASELIQREARYIDRHLWDEWLELFTPDTVFWIPAWRDDHNQTEDPGQEVSMIYCEGRARLSERVWRARSGLSIASLPLHRTMHTVCNINVEQYELRSAQVSANWSCHVYEPRTRQQHVFFGYYDYVLARGTEGLKIASKKITLLNDHLPITVDFYSV